jgi:16S rRNA (cytidine1402-2'-O)-methyltransferase
MQKKGVVYLIPSVIDEHALNTIPAYIIDAVKDCRAFFVENERTARRFLKSLWKEIVIDDYEWHVIHKAEDNVKAIFIAALNAQKNIGIISEAGCPCIADPGQILVDEAHKNDIIIKPLVGPSSIILALMASGMNGQHFCFSGYLPIDNAQKIKAIKTLEAASQKNGSTQIFIETPYRNNQLIEALLKNCNPSTRLCIAASITAATQFIKTLTIAEWKKQPIDINKKPAIFLLSAGQSK